MLALLYYLVPNVRHHGLRWITPGGVLAMALWVAASAGFALYVANFGSYNKTYGSLAGVIVFLVWLWLSNVAVAARAASSTRSSNVAERSRAASRRIRRSRSSRATRRGNGVRRRPSHPTHRGASRPRPPPSLL